MNPEIVGFKERLVGEEEELGDCPEGDKGEVD